MSCTRPGTGSAPPASGTPNRPPHEEARPEREPISVQDAMLCLTEFDRDVWGDMRLLSTLASDIRELIKIMAEELETERARCWVGWTRAEYFESLARIRRSHHLGIIGRLLRHE